ncbi:hypothetical protein HMPREF0454_00805 [Hafnia alvei ATCC 51873]|uniref:Uncharacterized protein n=1 Tax=Hafnia alvei ATCC 51873 TaxID=1002364 RepID=G9Y2J0_HAFAL|nr:hypothetical protein HMPREF0454_00805 [Hafnia alvei ATCC 51873]
MVSIISIVHYTKYQVIEDNKFRKNERADYDRIERVSMWMNQRV